MVFVIFVLQEDALKKVVILQQNRFTRHTRVRGLENGQNDRKLMEGVLCWKGVLWKTPQEKIRVWRVVVGSKTCLDGCVVFVWYYSVGYSFGYSVSITTIEYRVVLRFELSKSADGSFLLSISRF